MTASLREAPAWANYFQSLLKPQRPCRSQGGEFPKGQTCRGQETKRGHALFEQLECDPAHQENSRLRVLSFSQFGFRSVETNRSQVIAQGSIGTVKPVFGGGKSLGQLFAHAYH